MNKKISTFINQSNDSLKKDTYYRLLQNSSYNWREHFGFGKEENRIYEALIARITLSFFSYNIVSYINRMSNEPKTIGGLFKDLECELSTLCIAMQAFIEIMDKTTQIDEIVKNNKDFTNIIATL